MEKRSMWSLKLSTSALVLIPAAVGINYVGKAFAELLKLPLWLDAIGTILSSMLAGPVVGAISGEISNIISGITISPVSFPYGLVNIAIGLIAGVIAYKGWIKNIGRAVILGLIVALAAAVISTPINIIVWGGQTGNVWGDAVYGTLIAKNFPVWIASFVDEIIVDLPDKIGVAIISYLIFRGLPQKLTMMFKNNNSIEKL